MRDFVYFFTEKDGRCRQLVNGVVTSLNQKVPIKTPQGWEEVSIGWERSFDKYSNIRNFSLPLFAVEDGALIIKNDFYTFDFDRELYLNIYEYVSEITDSHYKDYYKFLYKAPIDFSSVKDIKTERRVSLSVLDGSLNRKIKAKEKTEYYIPFDDDAIDVLHDGLELKQNAKYIVSNGFDVDDYGQHLMQLDFASSEYNTNLSSLNVTRRNFADNADLYNSTDWFIKSGSTQSDLTVKYRIAVNVTLAPGIPVSPTAGARYLIRGFDENNNVVVAHVVRDIGGANNLYQYHLFEGETTFSCPPNTRLYFCCFLTINGNIATGPSADGAVSWEYDNEEETFFSAYYSYRHEATLIKAFKPFDLFKKILSQMGIEDTFAESEILQNSSYVITSESAIRGLENPVVKTSLDSFIKSFDIYLFGSTEITNKIRFIKREIAFPKVADVAGDFIELSEIKSLEVTSTDDLLASSFNIGHAEPKTEDINGKYSFNGIQNYELPIEVGNSKTLDFVAQYKADPFEIENLRTKYIGKETTDSGKDNKPFVLDIDLQNQNVDGSYNLYREAFDPFEGLPFPLSAYNIRLSPKRLLYLHLPWIGSILHNKPAGTIIKYISNSQNEDLIAGAVIEKSDIADNSINYKMFKPYYFDIVAKVKTDVIIKMLENANRIYSFIYEGKTYYGYLVNIGVAISKNAEQKIKLLSCFENDLKSLILQ